jgi:3-isopropylmalate/(R)-2-methylmalate dehydratase small subunit
MGHDAAQGYDRTNPPKELDRMTPLNTVEGVAAPLLLANIDTDVIIRIERVARLPRGELAPFALETLRFRENGDEDPGFILNQEPFRHAVILVAGENFGCGSSRENAVWALADLGIRVVIAPSFGDIFFSNCFQNGVLPIRLPAGQVARIAASLSAASPQLRVELEAQRVVLNDGQSLAFEVEPYRKAMLLHGQDEIGLTLARLAQIEAAEAGDRRKRPWLYR